MLVVVVVVVVVPWRDLVGVGVFLACGPLVLLGEEEEGDEGVSDFLDSLVARGTVRDLEELEELGGGGGGGDALDVLFEGVGIFLLLPLLFPLIDEPATGLEPEEEVRGLSGLVNLGFKLVGILDFGDWILDVDVFAADKSVAVVVVVVGVDCLWATDLPWVTLVDFALLIALGLDRIEIRFDEDFEGVDGLAEMDESPAAAAAAAPVVVLSSLLDPSADKVDLLLFNGFLVTVDDCDREGNKLVTLLNSLVMACGFDAPSSNPRPLMPYEWTLISSPSLSAAATSWSTAAEMADFVHSVEALLSNFPPK
jgi:hypothetical protein